VHHSGPGRLAKPYPVKDFHLLSFASLSWRTLQRVTNCNFANEINESAHPLAAEGIAAAARKGKEGQFRTSKIF
jgi:hypothetical protein